MPTGRGTTDCLIRARLIAPDIRGHRAAATSGGRRLHWADRRRRRIPGWWKVDYGNAILGRRSSAWRRSRLTAQGKSNASYRISAHFLNWVTENYDKEIVRKLNAAAREGRYSEGLWKELAGRTVQELGVEWKTELEEQRGVEPTAPTKRNAAPELTRPAGR